MEAGFVVVCAAPFGVVGEDEKFGLVNQCADAGDGFRVIAFAADVGVVISYVVGAANVDGDGGCGGDFTSPF